MAKQAVGHGKPAVAAILWHVMSYHYRAVVEVCKDDVEGVINSYLGILTYIP